MKKPFSLCYTNQKIKNLIRFPRFSTFEFNNFSETKWCHATFWGIKNSKSTWSTKEIRVNQQRPKDLSHANFYKSRIAQILNFDKMIKNQKKRHELVKKNRIFFNYFNSHRNKPETIGHYQQSFSYLNSVFTLCVCEFVLFLVKSLQFTIFIYYILGWLVFRVRLEFHGNHEGSKICQFSVNLGRVWPIIFNVISCI